MRADARGSGGAPDGARVWHDTEIALDGDLSELERLSAWIAEFSKAHALHSDVEFDLNLVIEELFTNSVRHGGCEGMKDAVRIRMGLTAEGVRLEYTDRGTAFNPLDAPVPKLDVALEERRQGGLGVHLVRQLMHDIVYQRDGDINRSSMTRRIESQ